MRSRAFLLLLALLAAPAPAAAHKLNVFAHVEGTSIRGNAYFRGGGKAQNASVVALDPAGKELGRTTTDAQGDFTLEARADCDYRLVVDAGDGHGGEYTVPAAELPKGLPHWESSAANAEKPTAAASSPLAAETSDSSTAADDPLAAKIDALNKQVVQLRQEIHDSDDRLRLRDLLGGLGYILGLTGAAFYFLGSRRNRSKATG
jgi:nickel transport protein